MMLLLLLLLLLLVVTVVDADALVVAAALVVADGLVVAAAVVVATVAVRTLDGVCRLKKTVAEHGSRSGARIKEMVAERQRDEHNEQRPTDDTAVKESSVTQHHAYRICGWASQARRGARGCRGPY